MAARRRADLRDRRQDAARRAPTRRWDRCRRRSGTSSPGRWWRWGRGRRAVRVGDARGGRQLRAVRALPATAAAGRPNLCPRIVVPHRRLRRARAACPAPIVARNVLPLPDGLAPELAAARRSRWPARVHAADRAGRGGGRHRARARRRRPGAAPGRPPRAARVPGGAGRPAPGAARARPSLRGRARPCGARGTRATWRGCGRSCRAAAAPTLVIEAVGRPETWRIAAALARPGGEVLLHGGCAAGSEVTLPTGPLHYSRSSPFAAPITTRPRRCGEALAMLEAGELPVAELVGEPIGARRGGRGAGGRSRAPSTPSACDRGRGVNPHYMFLFDPAAQAVDLLRLRAQRGQLPLLLAHDGRELLRSPPRPRQRRVGVAEPRRASAPAGAAAGARSRAARAAGGRRRAGGPPGSSSRRRCRRGGRSSPTGAGRRWCGVRPSSAHELLDLVEDLVADVAPPRRSVCLVAHPPSARPCMSMTMRGLYMKRERDLNRHCSHLTVTR